MHMNLEEELIAPCGIYCGICVAYFGYRMDGEKRKDSCPGCKQRDKRCAFLKKNCDRLSEKKVEYCFECEDFPCKDLGKLDERYREKYGISVIENLKFIKENGIENFSDNKKRDTMP